MRARCQDTAGLRLLTQRAPPTGKALSSSLYRITTRRRSLLAALLDLNYEQRGVKAPSLASHLSGVLTVK
jgi:hypothetical protein